MTSIILESIWIVVMIVQISWFGWDREQPKTCAGGRRRLVDRVQTRMLRLGLFWHFLDIVWVGTFSVVYLQGLARCVDLTATRAS